MKKMELHSSQMTDEQNKKVRESLPELFNGDNAEIKQFRISVESLGEPETLYHYTSIDTLEKILTESIDKEYFILRGTNIEYLNDSQELNLSIDIMQTIIKEFENQGKDIENKKLSEYLTNAKWKKILNLFGLLSDLYITSFSENPDSLPMWNIYGNNGNGVAIGYKKSEVKKTDSEYSNWGRCYYNTELFKTSFQKYFPKIYNDITLEGDRIGMSLEMMFNNLSFYFGILKHKSFEFENEWRLMKQLNIERNMIKFHPSSGVLKPFIENEFPKIDLKKIVLGPCADKELSKRSVQMLLQKAGFSSNRKDENFVEVLISEAPYRII